MELKGIWKFYWPWSNALLLKETTQPPSPILPYTDLKLQEMKNYLIQTNPKRQHLGELEVHIHLYNFIIF